LEVFVGHVARSLSLSLSLSYDIRSLIVRAPRIPLVVEDASLAYAALKK